MGCNFRLSGGDNVHRDGGLRERNRKPRVLYSRKPWISLAEMAKQPEETHQADTLRKYVKRSTGFINN
ncbi:hypothetical protein WN48_04311 [Eufriesea mexicana]|uniref:Uncharacterized protein n=1 Tax=Eufriesea mexicana TaxID=516756 RepID=A0A310SA49_9HYME|nr:hypothetical protein WN48_04311 [Eufriesea mexicana]